jgi:hypothetical protein
MSARPDAACPERALLAPHGPHATPLRTPARVGGPSYQSSETAVRDVFQPFPVASHLVWGRVWGRVVPDIPDFCRELVAALAEE